MMEELMKRAQEFASSMQDQQGELAQKTIDVSVGGDMVQMTFNGNQELVSVKLSPEVIDSNEPQVLEDLIRSAVNEGIEKSKKIIQEELGKKLGGLKIPGLNS